MRSTVSFAILAAAVAACGSTTSAPGVDTSADPPPSTVDTPVAPVVYETSAGVIETPGHGPEIAWQILESYPPQGGDLPITNWDWAAAPNSESVDGTTWGGSYRLVGTWDGTAFTLTEPPTSATTPPFNREYGRPTDDCIQADIEPVLAFTTGLDRDHLGIIGSGEDRWDGRCGGYVEALFDTPDLRAALEPMADRLITFFHFRRVGNPPPEPLPTLEPLETQSVAPTTTSTTTPS